MFFTVITFIPLIYKVVKFGYNYYSHLSEIPITKKKISFSLGDKRGIACGTCGVIRDKIMKCQNTHNVCEKCYKLRKCILCYVPPSIIHIKKIR